MSRLKRFTPEAMADIRYRYVETDEPRRSIAADYRMSMAAFERMVLRENFPMRKNRPPRDMPADLKLQLNARQAVLVAAQASPNTEVPAIADRLEAAVEKELAAVETMRAMLGSEPSAPGDAERTARTLERLTETLSKVRRLRVSDDAAGIDRTLALDIPKDIDEFRHALAIRIDTFARSRAGRGISQTGAVGGTGPSQS